MAGHEAERVAQFLATHAMLLLGLGLLASVASVVGIILAVRLVARFQGSVLHGLTELARYARRIEVVNRVVARTSALIPSAYLGVAVSLAFSWCVVMAFSRLFLGVHFASDVIAGLLAGAAWIAVCTSAFEIIRRRSAESRHV
jgi:membrane-associated phospholipid phosphatase